MATIDAFQGAEGSADAQRRALLAAIASQGSAGQAAHAAQQTAAQAARQTAVGAASARAGGGAEAAFMGNLSGANSTYMKQLEAAIPVSRILAESYQADALRKQQEEAQARKDEIWDRANRQKWDIQDRARDNEDAQRNRQWEMEDRAYELETRKAEAAAERAGAGGLAGLVKRLGGSDLAKPQLVALLNQEMSRAASKTSQTYLQRPGHPDGFRPGTQMNTVQRTTPLAPQEKARIVELLGERLGIGPGELATFLGEKSPAAPEEPKDPYAKPSPETIERVRNKPIFGQSVDNALANIRDDMDENGLTLTEARAAEINHIRSDPYMREHPVLRDLVIEAIRG